MKLFFFTTIDFVSSVDPRINLSCILIVLFAGCDSNGITNEPLSFDSSEAIESHTLNLPSVIDGRIVFVDGKEFNNFMDSIVNKDDEYLDSVETAMNFISLRSHTASLAAQLDKEVEEIEIVEDKFFASALNSSGEYQIYDVVYKVTRNFVYHVNEANAGYLDDIYLRHSNSEIVYQKSNHHSNLEVFEVIRFPDPDIDANHGKINQQSTCTSHFGPRRKILGEAKISDWGSYKSFKTVLKSQRKGLFGWWFGSTINWLRVQGNYSFKKLTYIERPYGRFSETKFLASGQVDDIGYNTKRFEHTHHEADGDNARTRSSIVGYANLTFSGQRTDKGRVTHAKCSVALQKTR